MDVLGILKDSLKYPFAYWKGILILGIIIALTGIISIAELLGISNIDVIALLGGIGFIIGFLVNGYLYKIISTSLNDKNKLPEFNDWIDMGADGAKVFAVFIIYLIPVIFVIIFSVISSFDIVVDMFQINGITLLYVLIGSLKSEIGSLIPNLLLWSYNIPIFYFEGIFLSLFGMLYIILITPLFLVSIAHMAFYEGEFKSAFRIHEIIEEISLIGWFKFIKWYIFIGIFFLVIELINFILSYITFLIHTTILENSIIWLLISLTLVPYYYIFISRSVALFYMPDEEE